MAGVPTPEESHEVAEEFKQWMEKQIYEAVISSPVTIRVDTIIQLMMNAYLKGYQAGMAKRRSTTE